MPEGPRPQGHTPWQGPPSPEPRPGGPDAARPWQGVPGGGPAQQPWAGGPGPSAPRGGPGWDPSQHPSAGPAGATPGAPSPYAPPHGAAGLNGAQPWSGVPGEVGTPATGGRRAARRARAEGPATTMRRIVFPLERWRERLRAYYADAQA
ncbi:hypothetical protein AB0J17_26470, partial [Streptomyces sp. NPDC049949]